MTDPSFAVPPAWVHKRDGRLVPFEADKISRSLFAAGESLGRPDAFLARELADGVVHFLIADGDTTPTTEQIAELVIKVVRELGQPALAEAYAEYRRTRPPRAPSPALAEQEPGTVPPPRATPEIVLHFPLDTPLSVVLPECVRSYTLQAVFTRDLVAAQGDGLLTLTGLETPAELLGCVLGPPTQAEQRSLPAALEALRRFAGRFVVLDGPEYLLAGLAGATESAPQYAREYAHELAIGLRITGLHAVVNLNAALPPSWADDLAEGPLFAGQRRSPQPERLGLLADSLFREFLATETSASRVRIDWHLGERDFDSDPKTRERLLRLARAALDGAELAFVFDRPKRAAALAEGVSRQHPAVLLTVGLHLPRLARHPGIDGNAEQFLKRLGSLARLALSAGVQKREFLRRQERARPEKGSPALTSGFLLDRARLVVAPLGLDSVVHALTGKGLCAGGPGLDLDRQIVQRLRDVLRQDGRASHLETCLDGPCSFHLDGAVPAGPIAPETAGLTPWDGAAPIKNQLRAGGALHAVAEHGTLALFVPEEQTVTPEQVYDYLRTGWRQTEIVRVRIVRAGPTHRQLTFGS